jgi:WD40 repeat protein
MKTKKKIQEFKFNSNLTKIMWSREDREIWAVTLSGSIGRWDINTGESSQAAFSDSHGIADAATNGDGTRLFTISSDGDLIVWETQTKTPIFSTIIQIGQAVKLEYNKSKNVILITGGKGEVKILRSKD